MGHWYLDIEGCDDMYRQLEVKIAYRGISKKQMAEGINMNYSTLLSKMGGKSKFTLDEAVKIRDYLEEDSTIEELFREE